MSRRARRRALRALAVSSALLLGLLLGELLVRASWRSRWQLPREAAIDDPSPFSFRLAADTSFHLPIADGGGCDVRTNSRGFRGPAPESLAGGGLRVVSVGDSFTFGWGLPLEEHCVALAMADYARAHPERDVRHAYLASPNWDPRDYCLAVEREAPAKLEVALIGVFPGNDVLPAGVPAPGAPPVPAAPSSGGQGPRWMTLHLLRRIAAESPAVTSLALRLGVRPAGLARFRADADEQTQLLRPTFAWFDALVERCRERGAEPVFLVYPSRSQVRSYEALDRAGYDPAAPERAITAYCASRGLACVTFLDALRAADGDGLYWPKDRHMTRLGNQVCAGVLREALAPILERAWASRRGGE